MTSHIHPNSQVSFHLPQPPHGSVGLLAVQYLFDPPVNFVSEAQASVNCTNPAGGSGGGCCVCLEAGTNMSTAPLLAGRWAVWYGSIDEYPE